MLLGNALGVTLVAPPIDCVHSSTSANGSPPAPTDAVDKRVVADPAVHRARKAFKRSAFKRGGTSKSSNARDGDADVSGAAERASRRQILKKKSSFTVISEGACV